MKKLSVILLLISAISLGFSSCKNDSKSATVKVEVTEKGVAKNGVTVYMFNSKNGPSTTFYTPFFAAKQSITENGGVATFELKEVTDLELIDDQTTLYFAVFNDDTAKGQTAVTIKKGETKTVRIAL